MENDQMKQMQALCEALSLIFDQNAPAAFEHLPLDRAVEVGAGLEAQSIGLRFTVDIKVENKWNVLCSAVEENRITNLFELHGLHGQLRPFLVKKNAGTAPGSAPADP
jgi:hypothetical protein